MLLLKFSFITNLKHLLFIFILKSNCLLILVQIINKENFGNSTRHTGNGVGASLVAQNPPVNAGYAGSIPGSGRFSGEGNGNPLQYSCLGNIGRSTLAGPQCCKESDMT